jgi:AcrR family transcriptional regulator
MRHSKLYTDNIYFKIFPLSSYISIVKIERLCYAGVMQSAEKKPYHHGDLREALLTAAEAALAELPLDQVSLREIARRAGVSHAAPKYHFGTLGGLLAELAARGFRQFTAELAAAEARIAEDTPEARLRASARAYLRFAANNRPAYGLMFGKRNEVEHTSALMTAASTAWSNLEDGVSEIVGSTRAPSAALLVWSCCHGLAMLMLDAKLPPHINPDVAIESMVRMVIAGLKAEA